MPPALELALILSLVVLLAVASATAGALWWRLRSAPQIEDLIERQRALTSHLAGLERHASLAGAPATPRGPRRSGRPAAGAAPTVAGPTLIAVPDLAGPPAEPSAAAEELGRRFGAIWALADAGNPTEAIARTTGQPIGQVELILGLRRQMEAAAGAGAVA